MTQEKGKPRSEKKRIGGVRAQEPNLTNQAWGTLKLMGGVGSEEYAGAVHEDCSLAQTNAVNSIPGGHIGENDFVSGLEALEDFDGVDGSLAELDVDTHGVRAAIHEFK